MKAKFLALAALVLGMVSCQNEPEGFDVNVGGAVDTVVTVNIPEAETRAGGLNSAKGVFVNGILAPENVTMRYILQVYYKKDATTTIKSDERKVAYSDGKSVNFDVRLVPGRDYQFVVWADVVTNGKADVDNHYNTSDLENVTLNNTWIAMDESRDAFTATEPIDNYNGQLDINIKLKRPFAKLRVITTDMVALENIKIEPKTAKVEYTTQHRASFNALAGTYADASVSKTHNFEIAPYSDNNETDCVLFTDYFFAADDVVKFNLTVNDQNNQQIIAETYNTDIYVKRNHLTTLKGDILTDGKNFTVTIEDGFATPGIDYEIWDGKTIKQPAVNATTGYYEVAQGSELAWLAAAVNGTLDTRAAGPNNFDDKTFVLTQDIDLGGYEWTPIGKNTGIYFNGTFDGGNHTITGLKITNYSGQNSHALFGGVAGDATLKNLVIDGAYIVNPEQNMGDFYAAGLVGSYYGNLTVENVTVKNSTFVGNNKVAGLIAHDGSSSSINVNNCHIYNCHIETNNEADGGNVGGLMGLFQGDKNKEHKISNSSVKKSTIVAINSTNTGKRANSQFVGGIKSKADQTFVIENCVVEGNTYTETFNVAEGATQYVGGYDNKFVGGDREDTYLGVVVINGTRYEGNEDPKNVSAEDGKYYATIDEAVKAGNAEVTLGAGQFDLGTFSTDVTIKGVDRENTVVVVDSKTGDAKKINFENVTVTRTPEGANYRHNDMETTQENYTNCIINGCVRILAHESATFTNCEFRNDVKGGFDGYSIHYYAYSGSKVYVNNCTFNTVSKAICIYNEGVNDFYLEVNDSEFVASEKDDKAAIQMHTEKGIKGTVAINNTTATGFADVNGGLWNEIVNSSDNIYGLPSQTPTNNFTIYVDGELAQLAGYTVVPGYEALFVDANNNYVLFNKQSLIDFRAFLAANTGRHPYDRTFKLAADIDAEGFVWNTVNAIPDAGNAVGFVLDGDNHTISNLEINGEGMFNVASANCVIKNLTIDGATSTSNGHNAAIFWGSVYSSVNFENVVVKNSTITGNCNVGTFVGGTYEPNNLVVKFNNCSVEKCALTANGYESQDPTGASGFVGKVYGASKVVFEGKNTIDTATTITNNNGLVGGQVYGYTTYENGSWAQTGISDEFKNWDGIITPEAVADGVTKMGDNTYFISNKAGMVWFANQVNVEGNSFSGKSLNLTADIDLENMVWTPIGQTGGNGVATYFTGSFNGNGHTISNLYVTPESSEYSEGKNYAAGLFGFVDAGDAEISNLTIDGANVKGHHWTGVITGYLTGTVTGCTVMNADVVCSHANDDACGDKASTVVGYINSGKVSNCQAEDCTVKAGRDAGQIVGCAKAQYVENCKATNVTVSANGDCTGANVRNEIIGRLN